MHSIFISWLINFFKSPTSFLLSLMDEHKAVRRGLVIWAAMQTQWVIHKVFDNMDKISVQVISALTVVVAPLVGLVVYYVHLRSADEGDSPTEVPK